MKIWNSQVVSFRNGTRMKLSCGSAGVVSPRPALARIRALTSSRSSWHSGNDTLFDKRIESGCKWYSEIGYFEILFESRYIYIYMYMIYVYIYMIYMIYIYTHIFLLVWTCKYTPYQHMLVDAYMMRWSVLKFVARTSRWRSSCSFWPSLSVRTWRTIQPRVDEANERAKQQYGCHFHRFAHPVLRRSRKP